MRISTYSRSYPLTHFERNCPRNSRASSESPARNRDSSMAVFVRISRLASAIASLIERVECPTLNPLSIEDKELAAPSPPDVARSPSSHDDAEASHRCH